MLTNRHLVADSQSLTVALPDGMELPSKIVNISDTTDLALIKVDGSGLPAAWIDAGGNAIGINSAMAPSADLPCPDQCDLE